jgi:hypothetical protein
MNWPVAKEIIRREGAAVWMALMSSTLLLGAASAFLYLATVPDVAAAHPAAAHGKPSDHSPVVATFNLGTTSRSTRARWAERRSAAPPRS